LLQSFKIPAYFFLKFLSKMLFPPSLLTLAAYLAGEFDNREQAIADPTWYVHLRLWQRPVALFSDSLTLFAEQANVLKLNNAYRQRLMRIQPVAGSSDGLQVQYYAFKDPDRVQGAGQNPDRFLTIQLSDIELLPGCVLNVAWEKQSGGDRALATPPPDCSCFFTYQGEVRQVVLGFEASPQEYLTYDKGVELGTGKALWGAMMGPYRYRKIQQYEL
jgi:CpeT/CpcT family (DUF1001)